MSNSTFLENYYNGYDEEGRLENSRVGRVEYLTTRRYRAALVAQPHAAAADRARHGLRGGVLADHAFFQGLLEGEQRAFFVLAQRAHRDLRQVGRAHV